MKTTHSLAVILILGTVAFFSSKESLEKNIIIEDNNDKIDSLKDSLNNYKERYEEKLDSLKEQEVKIYSALKKNILPYNPDISNETIKQFVKTLEVFDLNNSEKNVKTLLSQILYESGFQQHYNSKHRKAGQLVVSNANAIGACQIVPNTGYFYLRLMSKTNKINLLKELGCTIPVEISDFNDYSPNKKQREIVINWLSIEKNNFALWGFIMKHTLKHKGNFPKSLVAYNAGGGYLNNYLKKGKNPSEFYYVININRIAKKILI